ncbi:hypothetical protein ACH5RR_003832 [Cinchona calisaya]|uniref:Uncharacterized protein n=1 Tax=Cinchona calisaya TaxID=153742 RepID=A0ABD3AW99_9GENT
MDDDISTKTCHYHHQQSLLDQETEEADEALSLSGLILNSDEIEFQERRRSSFSDQSEFFEFFIDLNSEMSHAEDIIFRGKLKPYQENPPTTRPRVSKTDYNLYGHNDHPTTNDKRKNFHRKRSESLNDLKTSRSNKTAKNQQHFMRTSRSLDYQKLYGNKYNSSSSSAGPRVEIERNPSNKSSGKGDGTPATGIKEKIASSWPRWYMMFGLVKIPQEMAYQDIKSRKLRRNPPGSLFTSLDVAAGEKAIVNRQEDRRWSSNWDLLRVLSCKDHASVSVTASFGCMQHI